MASPVLVDSSVWIALYLGDDPQHRRAILVSRQLEHTSIYLPYCVLSEAVTVLTYKESKAQAARFLDFVIENERIIWIEPDRVQEIADFRSLDSRVSFADATLLGLARRLDCELVTFDQQLARLARKQPR